MKYLTINMKLNIIFLHTHTRTQTHIDIHIYENIIYMKYIYMKTAVFVLNFLNLFNIPEFIFLIIFEEETETDTE